MPILRFSLDIPAERYQAWYAGAAKQVQVTSDNGTTLRFPAAELRRHVTREGISGRFEIEFDERFKLVALRKIAP